MSEPQDDHFGLRPHCKSYTGYVKAGATEIFYCKEHNVSWIGGAGNLSGAAENDEEERAIYEAAGISGMERIEPVYWPRYKAPGDEKNYDEFVTDKMHATVLAELLLAIGRNFEKPMGGKKLVIMRERFDQASEIMKAIGDAIILSEDRASRIQK